LIASADPERLETWVRYSAGLCRDCHATCCTLPVEVRIDDLIRLELVDAFERDEPAKNIAKRLSKAGIVEHFNHKHEIFTLTRLANGDCLYLDRKTRLCTVYAKRPDTPAATTRVSARAQVIAPTEAKPPADAAHHRTSPLHPPAPMRNTADSSAACPDSSPRIA